MDGTRIQRLVSRGYELSARRIGLPHGHYRPTGTANPVAPANLLRSLPAAFSSDDYRFRRPQGYGRAAWTALVDGSVTQPGDYLIAVSDGAAWFIASQDHILPVVAVRCNAVVSIVRPRSPAGVGYTGYGGDVTGTEAPLIAGWPASLLDDGRGDGAGVGLPGDVKSPAAELLLPAIPGGLLFEQADTVSDDLGRRWKIVSQERSHLGWRLSLILTMA